MQFPYVSNIRMWGVYDRGVPNSERITLQNASGTHLDLTPYMLLLGWNTEQGSLPVQNRLFWFGGLTIDPDTWLYVYTGPGDTKFTTVGKDNRKSPAVIFHWGLEKPVFADDRLRPVLIELGATVIGESPPWLFDSTNLLAAVGNQKVLAKKG